jgi:hypothetical protein
MIELQPVAHPCKLCTQSTLPHAKGRPIREHLWQSQQRSVAEIATSLGNIKYYSVGRIAYATYTTAASIYVKYYANRTISLWFEY